MTKKIGMYMLTLILLLSVFSFAPTADAATVFKGTFEGLTYEEVEVGKDEFEQVVNGVTIRNSSGRLSTFRVNNATYYYINDTTTTIDGFKYGMEVEATVNLRTIKELNGKSDVEQGTISTGSKHVYGLVTKIDPNGMFVSIKPDVGREREYYVNSDTTYVKGLKHVDLSTLYEGDRVRMYFSGASSSTVDKMEIIQTGMMIENLYKAQLKSVNVTGNRFTVVNTQAFSDWDFGTNTNKKLQTFKISSGTTIYAGNKKISKNQLRNYQSSDIYFVTVSQFSQKVVKKIIVLENNERTYFDELTLVNPTSNYLKLKEFGTMYYHNGSILVRNGRLIEDTTLTASGSAFVLTDGVTKNTNTHVVNVVNDGFLSSNLASHDLYFGQLSLVEDRKYLLELSSFNELKQDGAYRNFWRSTDEDAITLSYSNNTVASRVAGESGTVLVTSLAMRKGDFGFFYVKDGHVQAVHLLDPDAIESQTIFTGRISSLTVSPGTAGAKHIDATGKMSVENVTQWTSAGAWLETARLEDVQISQALIIKDRKRITVNDLRANDRVVIFTDEEINAQIILVNE